MWPVLLLLLLLGAHAAFSDTHSLKYFYTAVSGVINIPEFTMVGQVDEAQFIYFDSTTKKAVPKTEWMRPNEEAYWDKETQTAITTHQAFENSIQNLMGHFNQTQGVHTVQEMYGCEWDDQTGETNAFRQFGYDGEDFMYLELKEIRWISSVQQGFNTQNKWNNNRGLIERDKNYLKSECIKWLKNYVELGKSSLKKTVSPQVSLLQKDPSSPVSCHATGFYPSGITISWMKNEDDHNEDVDLSELIPNEDGTFQKTSTLSVKPDDWKKDTFSCVVEHQGKTIRKMLIGDKIRTNNASVPIGLILGVVVALLLLVVIGVGGFVMYQKNKGFKPVPQNQSDGGSSGSSQT